VLLIDNSAWAHLDSPSLPAARRDEIAALIESGEIAVCAPFLLEAGWSARNAAEHATLLPDLLRLPCLNIDADVESAALAAQSDLARRGHHRSASSSDLLIAACAHTNAAGVLHYDRDYDHLVDLTDLRFESRWLAEPGTL
jgi:predicted nucleic acid-binding protein